MTAQPEDRAGEEGTIEGMSSEDGHYRMARREFVFAVLTPVWWVVMLVLINILAEIFPSTSPESVFTVGLWSFFAVLFPVTVAVAGVGQARAIRESEEQRGLWMARWATIIGTLLSVVSVVIIVMIIATWDSSTHPGF